MENFSDTDSYTSSYTSYTDSYTESYTYSSGSLTDSREFDEPIVLPETKPEVKPETISEVSLTHSDNKQDQLVEQIRDDSTNELFEVQTEIQENIFDSSFADITVIEANSIQVDSAENDESEIEDIIQVEIEKEVHEEDCAYQSDFDDQMKLRERSISQESYHSQPKSWSEFESETKQWRPVRLGNVDETNSTDPIGSNKLSQTKSSNESLDLSPNCSEGYRSSSSRDYPKDEKIENEKKFKNRLRTRSYERPRRNMDEFLKSVIPSPLEIGIKSTDENEIENVEPAQPTDRIPLEEKTIEQNQYSKARKNSIYSTESENSEKFEKIIKVKVTRTSDNRYTYGFLTDDQNDKIKKIFQKDKKENEIFDQDRTSNKSGIGVKRMEPILPQRRDTFTKKFEQSQKEALNGIEAVYSRHSQRASQLLMDLQISMAANGYGKYRNFQA